MSTRLARRVAFAVVVLLVACDLCVRLTTDPYSGRKEREARAMLRVAYRAELAYFAENKTYSSSPTRIAFELERGNRYSYYLAERGPLQLRASAEVPEATPDDVGFGVDQFQYPGARFFPTYAATACPLTVTEEGTAKTYPLGISGAAGDERFLIAAAGNVDDEPDLDCWSIASFDRVDTAGVVTRRGELLHEREDRERDPWWKRGIAVVLEF